MSNGGSAVGNRRIDAAGRPLEGRGRQALTSLSIIVSWICMTVLIFWATRGFGKEVAARFFVFMAIVGWLCAEAFGGRRALVWPASALAIAGSLSIGFALGLATAHMRHDNFVADVAIVSGVAAFSMATYLFRFRLPGLVSPIITFAIISLFLGMYGLNAETLSKIEGLSPRGILAALIGSPIWMAVFGILAGSAVVLARRLDLYGQEFGIASARPLHLIGTGVLALIAGRILGMLPNLLAVIGVLAVWIGGMVWALRINRFAVAVTVHLASAKPLVVGLVALFVSGSDSVWRPGVGDWTLIFLAIMLIDFVLWPRLHRASLARDWTIGPGGRIPQPRDNWWWRYWPYA